jgi:hypothetical protein
MSGKQRENVLVGFEVLTAASTKTDLFWVVAPCSLVVVYQSFRGPCCLHNQGDHRPDDGGSNDLRNFGKLPDYKAIKHRRQPSSRECFVIEKLTNGQKL